MRMALAAALAVTATVTMAQATLDFDDLVGVWNLTYEGGQTGSFTMSKNDDGSPKIVVSTAQGGDSEARDIMIEGDMIKFGRDINLQGQSLSVNYMARLVDGKLEGTGEVDLGGGGGAAGAGGGPTPFTATKAE